MSLAAVRQPDERRGSMGGTGRGDEYLVTS